MPRKGRSTQVSPPVGLAAFVAAQPALLDDGRSTLSSQIMDRMREAIVSGRMEAGAKIHLDRVRQTLDVSLAPLREALARLISEGLVVFEDNRGYQVAPMSLGNLEEITRLRLEFEIFALREAISIGDLDWEGDVIRAHYRLNKTNRDASRPETLEEWERCHRDFHLTLISGCNMPLLLNFCRVLLNLNDRYRRTFLRATSGDRNVGGEHSEIVEATISRDKERACRALVEHLSRTGTNLRRYLGNEATS